MARGRCRGLNGGDAVSQSENIICPPSSVSASERRNILRAEPLCWQKGQTVTEKIAGPKTDL